MSMHEWCHNYQTGLLLSWKCTVSLQWFTPQVVPLVFYAFPHKYNQYLLKVSDSNRVKQRVMSSHCGVVFEKCENVSGWLQMCSFILITRACWLVDIKGLSGAIKRTYCYIPALTTATSRGFPFYNNSKLILLNSQSTYLFGTKHFVDSSCWIK